MRRLLLLLLLSALAVGIASCSKYDASSAARPAAEPPAAPETAGDDLRVEAAMRKVIHDAELSLAVDRPTEARDEARAIAELHGGYVVSAATYGDGEETERIQVVLKVRAGDLDRALAALRKLGNGTRSESISSRDVTEEWVDLDARLRTHKKLEEQFLTILKEAKTVSDTLEVHRQLAATRSEIERLEGKRRLLDHQVALSTITLTIERQRPLVAFGGGRFERALIGAGADVVNVGAAIVIGGIRLLGVLLPIALLVLLPLGLALRAILRRAFRPARA
jgi:hypothetical protein